jgi:hypothetical protein
VKSAKLKTCPSQVTTSKPFEPLITAGAHDRVNGHIPQANFLMQQA